MSTAAIPTDWTEACCRAFGAELPMNYIEYDDEEGMFRVGHAVPDHVCARLRMPDGSEADIFVIEYHRSTIYGH